ncbi:MAG: ArsA family ATPase [Leptolyngbya sp. Prado105]|jgi:arsenite-transporting ATPase|nr:ArsA family ATPase [Leptolyngbya sp. Prado105]
MAFILTFLGKGGTGRTTLAIATAKKFASQGKRVLLVGQDSSPAFGLALGASVSHDPQEISPNFSAVQLQTTTLLERSWEEVKRLEAQYLQSPVLKNVFGQELAIFPGLDQLLALNAIREFDPNYDVIVYDGEGDQSTLRLLGTPETASWYIRRFRQVFIDSDLGRTVSMLIQPIAAAIFTNNNFAGDNFAQPTRQANDLLDQGKQAVNDPNRMAAFLVTTEDEGAIATAKYLWGSAQQIGLTVAGVLCNRSSDAAALGETFQPLPIATIPVVPVKDWQPLIDALPDLGHTSEVPRAIAVNVAERKVSLFLPGFDKKQVKLTQYGTEITIEAGDQRRNIDLPAALRGQPVTGAKFQDGYLIISF